MGVTAFTNWDFHNSHVQQELTGGQFISAESTLVAAGPPRSTDGTGADSVYPIGLLETFGIQQSRQLQRIFEIGSSRSYFIPGRVIGSLTIGRTFYFGPSLLRVIYAHFNSNTEQINIGTGETSDNVEVDNRTAQSTDAPLIKVFDASGQAAGSEGTFSKQGLHLLKRHPGYDNFFIDLASDLFAQPTGMAVYFKNADDVTAAAMYLNECYVQGHQMTISSGSVLIMEGASLQFDRIVPIQISNLTA